MSNHFHLLVRIKPHYLAEEAPPEGLAERSSDSVYMSDADLISRYEAFYDAEAVPLSTYSVQELKEVLAEDAEDAKVARAKIIQRMGNLATFVGELKKRFTLWHNEHHELRGTAWESRYKSVLVENSFEALSTVAAYIDLNPVRAQLTDDPVKYFFCGYAQA